MPTGLSSKVHGLFAAIITPFDDKGRPDGDALADLVRFQISKGIDGLYPCGSTGLGPMLQVEERKLVAETVVKSAAGRAPVVVQVGCSDTATTVELAKHAEKTGADAVASLTPYYYKPGEAAIVKHFEAVSKSIGVPLLAYNIPQFTGNNLAPNTVASMAKSGTIAGIKDSSRDFLQLQDLLDAVPDGFVVMNGTEEYGLYALMSGADGLVSGGSSALPEVFKALVSSQRRGDYKSALAAHRTILAVRDLVKRGPISAYYAILKERGVDCGVPRAPFLPLEEPETRRIVGGLKALKLI